MDFNKLKTFQIVAENSSVSKAAEILHVTQPAVSQQIALLEDQLGFRLLRRAHGQISLSPEAQDLLVKIREGFDLIESAVTSAREGHQNMTGNIRLGALMDHATPFSMSDLIMSFTREHPQVTFDLTFGSNADIERGLRERSLDLGLMIVFKDSAAFTRHKIYETKHCFVGPKKKSLKEILHSSRLMDFTDDFMCLTPWVRKNDPDLLRVLRSRRPDLIVPHHLMALDMIKGGWGYGVLPEYLCGDLLKDKKLVRLGPKDLHVELDLAYIKERTLRSYEKTFVHFVEKKTLSLEGFKTP